MGLTKGVLKRPVTTVLMVLCLIVFGISSVFSSKLELTPEMVADTTKSTAQREKEIVAGLKSMLGIKVDVKVVDPKTITRSEGKAVRVIDRRKLHD